MSTYAASTSVGTRSRETENALRLVEHFLELVDLLLDGRQWVGVSGFAGAGAMPNRAPGL